LGYRNQPKMTDERFIQNRYRNPFVNYVSDRLYKTGDLARYRFDGNIEFLRRNDKQVKVRGFRIELGEIEQNIKSHPAIEQTVAVVREDTPGDARLVAYVVVKSGQSISPSQLREHLKESVPYYMVPQHFVTLDAMPQTNNGKIDYKSLPAPTAEVTESDIDDVAMPETAAEKWLAGVWEQILEIDDVALNDTFFDIGGHSLLVMKVITTVNNKTGVKLGPQEFLMSTLEQMANRISESYEFEDVATVKSPEKPRDDESPEPPVVEAEQAKSSGPFKLLKGFWN
jgi:acyl carrier protein